MKNNIKNSNIIGEVQKFKKIGRHIRDTITEMSYGRFCVEEHSILKQLLIDDEELVLEFENARRYAYVIENKCIHRGIHLDHEIVADIFMQRSIEKDFEILRQYYTLRELCIITNIFEIDLDAFIKKIQVSALKKEDFEKVQHEIQEVSELFECDEKYIIKMTESKVMKKFECHYEKPSFKTLNNLTNSIRNVREKLIQIIELK